MRGGQEVKNCQVDAQQCHEQDEGNDTFPNLGSGNLGDQNRATQGLW